MKRLSLLLLALLVVAPLPARAIDETLQVQFLKGLFSRPESEWLEFMKNNTRVLDSTFFDRSEARMRWDLENNQVEDALRFAFVCDLAARAVGRNGQYRLGMAQAFYKAGNYQMAKDLIDSINLWDQNNPATMLPAKEFLAHMYRNENDYFNAWNTYDELQKAGYKRHQCLNEMASIDLKQGKEERARQELNEVLKLDPGNKYAKDLLATLDAPATFAPPGYDYKKEQGGGSQPTAATSPNANPAAGNKWFTLAEQAYKDNNLEAAEGNYLKAIDSDPKHVKARVYLAALYYRQGQLDQAIARLQEAIALDAADFEGWRYLGNCYERRFDTKGNKADLDAAVTSYQNGQKISPADKTINSELERALDKKNPSASR